MTRLSATFRSVKSRRPSSSPSKPSSSSTTPAVNNNGNTNGNDEKRKTTVTASSSSKNSTKTMASLWSVYLIISSRLPKTYVGVTTNFSRRLKQHNGELKGGAKASSAGRPWTLACIVRGFTNRSEACEFESKWKSISRKMPRKKRKEEDHVSNSLLEHREAALSRLKASFNCSNLLIEWKSSSH